MHPTLFGIKNCDTMKKAFRWLDDNEITYDFHDYKKDGIDKDAVTAAIEQHGWETVINRRGTSWRQLTEDTKASMNAQNALTAASENPSLIKRPLLLKDGKTYLGFKDTQYAEIFE